MSAVAVRSCSICGAQERHFLQVDDSSRVCFDCWDSYLAPKPSDRLRFVDLKSHPILFPKSPRSFTTHSGRMS